MIYCRDLSPAKILMRLYNYASPKSPPGPDYHPGDMMLNEAQILVESSLDGYFSYVKGRPILVNVIRDLPEIDEWLYDKENGLGSASKALFGK